MNRVTAASRGHLAGARLAACGRASRLRSGGDDELWSLPLADEPVGGRLLVLGQRDVGGFVDGGVDEGGVWLVRRLPRRTLRDHLREAKGPRPAREAISLALDLARALSACERASLFPGPVTPELVLVEGEHAMLPAERLVRALVGAPLDARAADETASPLWTPPDQAEGAVWDAAANRYALGLVLYRLLSGAHPFEGAGLRHALGEASRSEAPPFEDAVAQALPAGLQSLALRLLDPEKAHRPANASLVVSELDRFLTGNTGPARVAAPRREGSADSTAPTGWESRPVPKAPAEVVPAAPPRPRSRALLALWPIAVGLLLAACALWLLAPAPETRTRPAVPPEAPLDAGETAASDCGKCHARQAAEWRRSIMAHSVKSPLFNALESLIEEQVGRDDDCPNGAGILRKASGSTACRDRASGVAVTGSGGEHWCVNCHSPAENLAAAMPAWDGRPGGDAASRRPVRDLLGARAIEGVSCAFCHSVHGPVGPRSARGYQGNATWTSFVTGALFAARPEDARGLFGVGNSGYDLRPEDFLVGRSGRISPAAQGVLDPVVHLRAPAETSRYLRSSEFCGACHDVRLFGTDTLGARAGEHFKRLRNAYSEWASWAAGETRAGRTAATCQDCHMSAFPGVCAPDGGASPAASAGGASPAASAGGGCPPGMHLVARAPGEYPTARVADNSPGAARATTHYFSGVDMPLALDFPDELVDEPAIDANGVPLSARTRRDLLLRAAMRLRLGDARRAGGTLEIPIEIENIGAGHRVPAGFSQEREIWVHLTVRDGAGRVVYEVGRVDRGDEDLRDKVFERVSTRGDLDARGRPEGLFGADVSDGPDVPRWQPPPELGGASFRGLGLINFQNGFLRCVRCIGIIGPGGRCEAGPGQGGRRADRFADGDYDLDTGECRSNLEGRNALFETYFPVGALDASRGLPKGPDAIIDTRSLPPGAPVRYTYELPTAGRRGPFQVEARLLFRAFPPYLVKAFAAYEREQARRGLRPSGALVTEAMLRRLEVVEIARGDVEIR